MNSSAKDTAHDNPSTTERELVSVIMPTYNESRFIAGSIESVLQQTYHNIELLITDDCSSNHEVVDILEFYRKKDKRVRVFYLPENKGAGNSRNKSVEEAKGRYIAFCDSDDRWMPDKIEKQLAVMNEKNCCLCFSEYLTCDEDDNITGIVTAPRKTTLSETKKDNKIGCLTGIYDTKPYGKFFFPLMRKRQDWALFLNILKKCGYGIGVQEPLAIYRKRNNSISKNKGVLLRYNALIYQEIFGFSVLKSYVYLFLVFFPSYMKKIITNSIRSKQWLKSQKNH